MRSQKSSILVLALLLGACSYSYSDGDRTGTPVKLSRKGVFNKSWEGEINLGGMTRNGDGNMVPTVFEFSLADDARNLGAMLAAFDSATQQGKRVKVWYKQAFIHNPIRFSSGYLLDSIKVIP